LFDDVKEFIESQGDQYVKHISASIILNNLAKEIRQHNILSTKYKLQVDQQAS